MTPASNGCQRARCHNGNKISQYVILHSVCCDVYDDTAAYFDTLVTYGILLFITFAKGVNFVRGRPKWTDFLPKKW
jgi:hypothetical protein